MLPIDLLEINPASLRTFAQSVGAPDEPRVVFCHTVPTGFFVTPERPQTAPAEVDA